MAALTGTNVGAPLAQFDSADQFGTHFADRGIGGKFEVANIAARDAIFEQRRTVGMFVTTQDDGKTYQLKGGITNNDWVEFEAGEGPQGPAGTAATITSAVANTLPAGSSASVTMGGTAQARTFTFGIPTGAKGDKGDSPIIGGNGNWWVGGVDTGYAADRFIVTELSVEDPSFPTEPGKFTVSLAGQPANTGPKGNPGVPGVDAWTAEYAVIADATRRVLQIVNWHGGTGVKPAVGKYLGSTGWVDDILQAMDIRGPGGEGGGGSGGLPENAFIATNEAELMQALSIDGAYIIVPYAITFGGGTELYISGPKVIDGMGLGSITLPSFSAFGVSANVTIKNIKLSVAGDGYSFFGKLINVTNCQIIEAGSGVIMFQNGSHRIHNCIFNKSVQFSQNVNTTAVVTGCICAGTFTWPTGQFAESGNITNATMANWG